MNKRVLDTEEPFTRESFAGIMKRQLVRFDPDRGADAREMQQMQPARWADLIRFLQHALAGETDPQAINEFAELFSNALTTAQVGLITVDGAPTIQAEIPVLPEDPLGKLSAFVQADPWFALTGVIIGAASAIGEKLRVAQSRPGLDRLLRDPRLMRANIDWIEIARVEPALKQAKAEMSYLNETAASASEERHARWETDKKRLGEILDGFREEARQALRNLEIERLEAIAKVGTDWTAFHNSSVADLEATKRRVTEQAVLYKAHDLWSRKARIHAISFGLGLFAIALVVIAGVSAVLHYGPAYLAALPRKPDGEVSYIIIATLTASVVAVGWLLRFVGRYAVENMVLQADAAQRKTMVQTYLALVGIKEANVEQADRTLILNAIFRPLPGHQSDDVAPPTLLDVMKSTTGKG